MVERSDSNVQNALMQHWRETLPSIWETKPKPGSALALQWEHYIEQLADVCVRFLVEGRDPAWVLSEYAIPDMTRVRGLLGLPLAVASVVESEPELSNGVGRWDAGLPAFVSPSDPEAALVRRIGRYKLAQAETLWKSGSTHTEIKRALSVRGQTVSKLMRYFRHKYPHLVRCSVCGNTKKKRDALFEVDGRLICWTCSTLLTGDLSKRQKEIKDIRRLYNEGYGCPYIKSLGYHWRVVQAALAEKKGLRLECARCGQRRGSGRKFVSVVSEGRRLPFCRSCASEVLPSTAKEVA